MKRSGMNSKYLFLQVLIKSFKVRERITSQKQVAINLIEKLTAFNICD